MRPGKRERQEIMARKGRKWEQDRRASLVSPTVIPTSRFAEKAEYRSTGTMYHRWTGDGGLAKPKPASTKRFRRV